LDQAEVHSAKIDLYEKRNRILQEANDVEIMSKGDDEISRECFRLLKQKKLNELKASMEADNPKKRSSFG
jgi:hypothetical protein